jgi:hypothetical protein
MKNIFPSFKTSSTNANLENLKFLKKKIEGILEK